jgi:hypothetical protein
VIFIMDQSVGEVPKAMNKALVAATPSCIAVGTLSEHDGETLISLSDGAPPPGTEMSLVFGRSRDVILEKTKRERTSLHEAHHRGTALNSLVCDAAW